MREGEGEIEAERDGDQGGERGGSREVEVNHQSNWSSIIRLASGGEGLVEVVGES